MILQKRVAIYSERRVRLLVAGGCGERNLARGVERISQQRHHRALAAGMPAKWGTGDRV